ncbi:MAG TPA: hypothetical protein VLD15_05535 [Burkholderiales bacterium]|nr:hypothetical protein [Burkholderiales bacterium]
MTIARPRVQAGLWLLGACAVALLPDPYAAIPWWSYYFRDFSLAFLPLRQFQAAELAAGRLPFWNPYVHEGEFMLPSFYPLDLLHVLDASPQFVSWLLTLHFPLAALGAYALARARGLAPLGAFTCGAVYSVGGFALSALNLYVFLQALALAPFVVLTCERAATRGGRWIAGAALAVAVSLTTFALEIVGQAVLLGVLLALWRDAREGEPVAPARRAALRLATALALGVGLAGIPVAITLGILPETQRGAGIAAGEAGELALPPLALLQLLVPNLFGALTRPIETWWGSAVFRDGTPYFLSLYVGVLALALAVAGAAKAPCRERILLVAAAVLGTWLALGPAGGLWTLLHELPLANAFRTPSKALFVVHLAAALLAGRGADRLASGEGWALFSMVSAIGLLVAGAIAAASWLAADQIAGLLQLEAAALQELAAILPADAARCAAIGLLGPGLAFAVMRLRLRPRLAAALVALAVAVDLARAGAGLNRQASPLIFVLQPEIHAERLHNLGGGRVFAVPVSFSRNFLMWLNTRQTDTDQSMTYAMRQQLEPYNNLAYRVETAGSQDRTRLSPLLTSLGWAGYDTSDVTRFLPLLRHAAVSRILSFDPLEHPELRLRRTVAVGLTGLALYVYELIRPWPRALIACRAHRASNRLEAARAPHAPGWDPGRDVAFEGAAAAHGAACSTGQVRTVSLLPGEERYEVESDGAGWLLLRSTHARGWRATVNSEPAAVLRADGRHRAVAVPSGRHIVTLRYEPPWLWPGALVTLLSGVVVLGLAVRRRKPARGR